MELGLKGKVAIVTGGSEGIGRATARQLAREGASVVICARRESILLRTADELRADAEVHPIVTDATKPDAVLRLVDQTIAKFGRLDILVNNAGTASAHPFDAISDEVW